MPARLRSEFDRDAPIRQTVLQAAQLDLHDPLELLFGERLEHDDLIDPVEELRPEVPAQFIDHGGSHHRVLGFVVPLVIEDAMRADVRGHDDDRVLEIDHPALTVRKPPVVENLQEHVEDIRRGLLDFVEQHDARKAAGARLR